MKPYGSLPGAHHEPCREYHRQAEQYGDVVLSVQASWANYCEHERPLADGKRGFEAQFGCPHEPLERYATVEIAMFWPEGLWITKPSVELGIDGFDDLWNGDDVARYVPLSRVGQLQVELAKRELRLAGIEPAASCSADMRSIR